MFIGKIELNILCFDINTTHMQIQTRTLYSGYNSYF